MKKRYSMDLDEMGGRLRAVREALKLTMEDMRNITGYSKSLISAAENGLKKPSVIYLYALFDKYDVNVHYIFNGEGPMFLDEPEIEKTEQTPEKDKKSKQLTDNFHEMMELMEEVEMVRYAMLTYFIRYKTENKRIIDQLLEEIRQEKAAAGTE